MGETAAKDRSISITIGRVITLVGVAISLFSGSTFFGDFGWAPKTAIDIGGGMTLLGVFVVVQDRLVAWVVAMLGVAILVGAATHGNLYGSGATYRAGVVIANALAA